MSSNKSVTFVNPYTIHNTVGGAEVQLDILSNAMSKHGWEVHFITLTNEIPNTSSAINYIPFKETDSIEENTKLMGKLFNELNSDIYYQRGRKLWTYYAGKAAIENHKNFVFASSMDIDCRRFKESFRTKNSLREKLRHLKKLKKNVTEDNLTLRGMKSASLILSQTEQQKSLLEKNLSLKSSIFPNVHHIPKPNHDNKNKQPVVLWLANVKAWKQPGLFLRLANDLRDVDCKFIMAGNLLDNHFEEEILRTQQTLSNFEYISHVPFSRSNDYFKMADLYISTSIKNEGFPNTFIQSWMHKTPTISLNFDPDNTIQRYKIGEIANSYAKLKQSIMHYLENQKLRQEAGERAYKYCATHHNIDTKIQDLIRIFDDLIEKSE